MRKKKGIALFLVLFISLLLFIVIIGLLYILGANLRQLQAYDEKTKGYYLCETAASVAILDIGKGNIGPDPGQWKQRTFNFVLDGVSYPVSYTVSRENQRWIVITDISSGFKRPYHLRVGGTRGFLIFIIKGGFAGK